ncbi:hypothetical protein BH11MYX3_BH11MYX3_35770 [soil metagenome]
MFGMSVVRGVVLSAAWLAGCGSGGGFPDAPPIDSPKPPGTFDLAWKVTDTSGNVITCDQIGAQTVTVLTRNRAIQGGSTEVFTCQTLMGTSGPLIAGTYDMSFELSGTGGEVGTGLIATAPQQSGIVITPGGKVELTPLTFAANATGGLKLNLASNKPGGNCGTVANNGAGITGMSLILQHAGTGTCEPITLTYPSNGTLPGGTYTVNCTNATIVPCIEADQALTATGVPSGGYQVHVRGKIGSADCWANDDSMSIPPLARELVRTLNLGATATPCP